MNLEFFYAFNVLVSYIFFVLLLRRAYVVPVCFALKRVRLLYTAMD